MYTFNSMSCRFCLTSDRWGATEDFSKFASFYKKFFQIDLFDDDGPKNVCESCATEIKNIENFYETCQKTEKILEQYRRSKTSASTPDETVFLENEDSNDPLDNATSNENELEDTYNEHDQKNVKQMNCCDICGKEVTSSNLKRHLLSHQNEAKDTFFCDICDYTSKIKHRFRYHMRQKHLKMFQYSCEYCSRVYHDENSLKFHTSHKHTQKFACHCTICNKGFISQYRLKIHMAKHSDLRQYNCDICGDSFKTDDYLKRHKRETHSRNMISCKDCSKTFKNSKLLRQHEVFHKPNTYYCVVCVQSFAVAQTLRAHLKRFHKDLPLAPPGTKLRNVRTLDEYLKLCN